MIWIYIFGRFFTHSSLMNYFNSGSKESFWVWLTCLRLCNSISVIFKSRLWLMHSKSFALMVCFGSLSAKHPSMLKLMMKNWRTNVLVQDILNCCAGFTPAVTGYTPSKKFHVCLVTPQNEKVWRSLGNIRMFSDKCEIVSYVLFVRSRALHVSHDEPFCLVYFLLINYEHWP